MSSVSVRTLLLIATILPAATGCGTTRNFLFGRGARCGLCSRVGAIGQAINPLAPPPAPVAPRPGCGLFNKNAPVYVQPAPMPGYGPAPYAAAPCPTCPPCPTCVPPCGGDCGYAVGYGDCGCHEGVMSDPYLAPSYGSPSYGTPSYGGGYDTGEAVVPGSATMTPSGNLGVPNYNGSGFLPVPQGGDNFGVRSNRIDTDGARIIHEDPLPPGVRLAPLN